MPFVHEAAERILIKKIPNIQTYTTVPNVPPVGAAPSAAAANAFENIMSFDIRTGVQGLEDERRILRFHLLEVDLVFGGVGALTLAMFMSRINPAGIAAGGNPGAYNSDADDADTWGTFGPQTANSNPFDASIGNRLRFAVGGARFCMLVAATGGIAAEAYVYGITDRRGGLS